jgi:hypothetical protein
MSDEGEDVPVPRVSPLKSAPDTTISIMTYFDVRDKDAFLRSCQRVKELVRTAPGVKYYGFSMTGNVAVSKEGHANIASYLMHLRKVQDHWFDIMSAATITNMEAHGPKEQVDQLEDSLKDLLSSHWAYVDGAFIVPAKYLQQANQGRLVSDETLCVLVYWNICDYAKFLAGVKDFQQLTKQEEKVKYYGFCMYGAKAICREGYDCAEGFLEHLKNVDEPLKAAMEVAEVVRIEVHGPASEVEKLREPLNSFPTVFWPYPNDSFFAPAEYASLETPMRVGRPAHSTHGGSGVPLAAATAAADIPASRVSSSASGLPSRGRMARLGANIVSSSAERVVVSNPTREANTLWPNLSCWTPSHVS